MTKIEVIKSIMGKCIFLVDPSHVKLYRGKKHFESKNNNTFFNGRCEKYRAKRENWATGPKIKAGSEVN